MIYWSHKISDISIQSQVLSMDKFRVVHQNMQKIEAYLADAIAALFGSILGVSTVATFAESTAGVADGAKTGGFYRKGPRWRREIWAKKIHLNQKNSCKFCEDKL